MEEFMRACHDVVRDAEAKKLAAVMGLSHVSLLQRANPDNDDHKLTINHLYQILLHTADMRPLKALAAEFSFDLVERDQVQPKALTAALLHMNAEVADVTRATADALNNGRMTQIQRAAIVREVDEAIAALQMLRQSAKVA